MLSNDWIHPVTVMPVFDHLEYFEFELAVPTSTTEALTNLTGRKFKNPTISSIDKKDSVFFSGKNLWILKPSGLNRGKGLELFSRLEELREFLKLYMSGYDVKEFAAMSYDDNHNVSPSFVKYVTGSSQSKWLSNYSWSIRNSNKG
jgi:hypothetical protein